jgi:hypothetical protein
MDLPGWQALYDELKDQNFEIVAAAQDTGGEAAARPFYERANATFTALIDQEHTVSRLYNMVNVPTGVWIDEEGRIVRPNEVAYSRDIAMLTINVKGSAYVDAIRDWVKNGPDSSYVMSAEQIREHMAPRSKHEALADAHFRMAVHFHEQGDAERSASHFSQAQSLRPESWNYHRQEWSFTPKDAMKHWMAKYRELGEEPYYAPLTLTPAASGD